LRQEGALADAAALAILAHSADRTSRRCSPRAEHRTPTLARVLGAIGDQRAFHGARDYVKRGSVALRAEAALAPDAARRAGKRSRSARHWSEREI
jgi:hypothetical protein